MSKFYLVVEKYGDLIKERYIEDGVEKQREVVYQPTMFTHVQPGFDTKYSDIYGKPCMPKRFRTIKEANEWIQKSSGITEVLGQDDFRLAYIADTYKEKEITYSRDAIRVANCDIEVTAAEFPDPQFAKYEIDAITHYDSIEDKYFVFDLLNSAYGRVTKWDKKLAALPKEQGGDEVDQEILDKVVYFSFETEKEMLVEYVRFWKEHPPVIFTGWNVEGFDIPYIINRIKNTLGPSFANQISPFNRITSKVIQNIYGDKEIFTISGIQILDYLDLYKKFSFTTQPTYKLDYIAEYEVKMNKLEYDGPINKLRGLNHQRYISYNIIDVHCVQMIDKKRGFINLSISMAYYAKMNIQSVMSPVKTWDAIIFNSLKADNLVMPEVKSHVKTPYVGAYVKVPKPGAYKYVLSFDVTSLYPSIIRQVNISPETIAGQSVPAPLMDYITKTAPKISDEFSCSPSGMMYSKDKQGIIPKEIAKVFFQRKEWKAKMMAAKRNSEVIKKILESK